MIEFIDNNSIIFLKNDINLIFPEIFLSLCSLYILVLGVFINIKRNLDLGFYIFIAVEVLLLGILLIINSPYETSLVFGGLLILNRITSIVKILILFSGIVVILISMEYNNYEELYLFDYIILILFSLLAMLLLVSSHDLIMMYLAIELQSLCFYILTSLNRDSELGVEASLKYFILGALSSGILLFGCSLIYGLSGSTGFINMYNFSMFMDLDNDENYKVFFIGVIFIIVSLFFKLAVAPFHMWIPDVYEGAPMIVVAYFAIVSKLAIIGLIIQLYLDNLYGCIDQWQQITIGAAILSMIIGSVGALGQIYIKRLLAYSAITNIGYILMALSTGTVLGLESTFIYIVIYIITLMNLFSIFLSLYKIQDNKRINNIYELSGLAKKYPVLGITLTLTLLSMAGIPPLAGFLAKFSVLSSVMISSMYIIAIIAIITSVIASVYYLRLIHLMYFNNPIHILAFYKTDINKTLIMFFSIIFIIIITLNPSFLLLTANLISLEFYI